MNEYADKLVLALRGTGFVEPISWDVDPHTGATKALCRVPKSMTKQWASLVHAVLLKEEAVRGNPGQWLSHICRLYMLREGRLIYGWFFCVTPYNVTELIHTLDIVCRAIGGKEQPAPLPRPKWSPPNPAMLGAYSPPLDADAAGNPVVPNRPPPEEGVIPMAGLPPGYDRNRPKRGRGSYKVESSNDETFKPPRR